MGIVNALRLAWVRHCEYTKVMAELESYTDRELVGDLRVDRADFSHIAAEAAEQQVRLAAARLAHGADGRQVDVVRTSFRPLPRYS
ncbi:MAG: hypothetical protein U1E17_22050 [Geminicoccaceae bacterium]